MDKADSIAVNTGILAVKKMRASTARGSDSRACVVGINASEQACNEIQQEEESNSSIDQRNMCSYRKSSIGMLVWLW